MHALYMLLSLLICCASANVEKTIFLGPPPLSIPTAHPNLDDLSLIPLTPSSPSARTRLNASFPTGNAPKGTEHWLLLDGLSSGARYEVRVCWLATQPTAFLLDTYTIREVFDNSELLSSLSAYAYARRAAVDDLERQKLVARRATRTSELQTSAEVRASVLFLRIFAAADYYTLDQNLMKNVPPVLVDIILDPYLLNVFPESLLPTAGYILVVVVASWFLSGHIWQLMLRLSTASDSEFEHSKLAKKKS